MNRPLTPSLSPSEGERVPEGQVRGWFMVPMHAKNERGLSMSVLEIELQTREQCA